MVRLIPARPSAPEPYAVVHTKSEQPLLLLWLKGQDWTLGKQPVPWSIANLRSQDLFFFHLKKKLAKSSLSPDGKELIT